MSRSGEQPRYRTPSLTSLGSSAEYKSQGLRLARTTASGPVLGRAEEIKVFVIPDHRSAGERMATDLYVLYQTDAHIPPKKRRKQFWFGNEGSDTSDRPAPEVEVVIGQGDIYVSLVTGEIGRRSYIAITTCHLCKAETSRNSDTIIDPKCILCAERKDFYHRLAEKRVRHALKMGYQRVHGPCRIAGTAPIPFPNLDTAPGEDVAEVMADVIADLDMAEELLDRLKSNVVGTYRKMINLQQTILVRKFGMNVFKVHEGFRPGEILDIARTGTGDQARLKRGQNRLKELKIDIVIYRKVWGQMRRMIGRRPSRH